jgi:hypothetical protein
MPAKLLIPEQSRLPREVGYRFRPRYEERTPREREALMNVVLIGTTLWGLFWFQFCISACYQIPAFYSFSGGNWYHPPIDYYTENSGPFPWSLAGTFLFLSFFASALGLSGAWLCSSGVNGKWRMRFSVLIFSSILCGWSVSCYTARVGVADGLKAQIERERTFWQHNAIYNYKDCWVDDYQLGRQRAEIERLEGMLEKWEAELR